MPSDARLLTQLITISFDEKGRLAQLSQLSPKEVWRLQAFASLQSLMRLMSRNEAASFESAR